MRDPQFPGRSPVMSAEVMAATSQPMATQVALHILREGGNAIDAAIAASATLAVVESYATGIGGDCFILYHEAARRKLHALNGSGRSPARATIDALKARGFRSMPVQGILPVTVPGAVDAWYTAHQALGSLEFAQLLQPAIRYAELGYAVSPVIAQNWRKSETLLAATPEASAAYLVNGKAPMAGTVHRQPDLAVSLKLIASRGRAAFYEGPIAEAIVRFSDANDGLLDLCDFADHRSEWVIPIHTEYRGYKVCEIPPNGQGITTLMALNILSQTRLSQYAHLSADHIHLLSESLSLSMAERDHYVADPAFGNAPIERLLSNEFAIQQFARIKPDRAHPQPIEAQAPDHKDTVYLTVVDKDRNACSLINSVFHAWGSGLVAGNTGINLQNRGAGFTLEEGHPNRLEPVKRPLHTIIPAMVYRHHQPVLSFGVMGGQYQPMGQTYVLSNWIDYGLDIQESIDAARFFLNGGELAVESGVPAASKRELVAMGHTVVDAAAPHGGAQAIFIDWLNGTLHGGSDPRKDGCAAGY